jgi:hypothetical protein
MTIFCYDWSNIYKFDRNVSLSPFKQGGCHNVALPFTLKKFLKAKEELWKLKYFTMQKYT